MCQMDLKFTVLLQATSDNTSRHVPYFNPYNLDYLSFFRNNSDPAISESDD